MQQPGSGHVGLGDLKEGRLLFKVDLHGVAVTGRKGIALGRIDHVGRPCGRSESETAWLSNSR